MIFHMLIQILLAAALLVLAWLVVTWFFADDEKVLGPASVKRVTFKQVVQAALRDVWEVFNLGALCRTISANAVALAVLLAGMVNFIDERLRTAILHATWDIAGVPVPIGGVALAFILWLASLKSAQPGAPSVAGGPGAEAERA